MNKRLLKTAVGVGALAAIACFIYLIVLHSIGQNPFGRHKYMAIGIYGVFFAVAMWWYRDKMNNYVLRGREGLILGLLMNVISTAIYVSLIYSFLSYTSAGTKVMTRYKAESMELLGKMKEANETLTSDEYQQTVENIQNFNPPSLAIQQVSFYHGFGVFLTFLFMFIFKHNPNPTATGSKGSKKR